jgi:hypothetical protein
VRKLFKMDLVQKDVVDGWTFQSNGGCVSGESRRRGVDVDVNVDIC